MSDNIKKVTMMTINECASTGILPAFTLRQLVKQNKIIHIIVGKNKVYINYDALIEQLQRPDKAVGE